MTTFTLVCALLVPILMGLVTMIFVHGGCFDHSNRNTNRGWMWAIIMLLAAMQSFCLLGIIGSGMGIFS